MKIFFVLEVISRDLLYALRTMRKNLVFTATAVLTLALAIGEHGHVHDYSCCALESAPLSPS